jgi:hypothetical protein
VPPVAPLIDAEPATAPAAEKAPDALEELAVLPPFFGPLLLPWLP